MEEPDVVSVLVLTLHDPLTAVGAVLDVRPLVVSTMVHIIIPYLARRRILNIS